MATGSTCSSRDRGAYSHLERLRSRAAATTSSCGTTKAAGRSSSRRQRSLDLSWQSDSVSRRGGVAPLGGGRRSGRRRRGGRALSTRCRQTPFRLERSCDSVEASGAHARGQRDQRAARARTSSGAARLGLPFIEPGCRLEIPARAVVTRRSCGSLRRLGLRPASARAAGRAAPNGRHGRPARDPGTGDRESRRSLRDRSRGGLAERRNPRADSHLPARMGPRGLRLDRPVAAVRRRQGEAVERLIRAGVEPWTSRLTLEEAVAAGEAIELVGGDV